MKDRYKKGAFSTNAQSRFASVVFDGVLGPPCLARHTLGCPCFFAVPKTTHKASHKLLKCQGSSESPSRDRDGDEGVAGRNIRKYCFTDEGSLIS